MASRFRGLIFVLGLLAALTVSGLSIVAARVIQPDGRINQVSHFGGDAFYCIDSNGNPTYQFGENGFLLLDIDGQPLMRIEAATVEAVVAQAQAQGGTLLVAEGQGSYGPVQLYVQILSNGDYEFYFFAYDEYFKQNSMIFKFCQPQGVAEESVPTGVPTAEPTAEPTDEPVELCYDLRKEVPLSAPAVSAPVVNAPAFPIIPCDECEPPALVFVSSDFDLPICTFGA